VILYGQAKQGLFHLVDFSLRNVGFDRTAGRRTLAFVIPSINLWLSLTDRLRWLLTGQGSSIGSWAFSFSVVDRGLGWKTLKQSVTGFEISKDLKSQEWNASHRALNCHFA
jgi:hypothetical protein